MAYFSLINGVDITMGQVRLRQVNHVHIEKSWQMVTDTAKITFPKNVQFSKKSEKTLTDYIKKGGAVVINLGYDGNRKEEFVGYVTDIDLTIPITISCEDEMYQLKRKTFSKSWKNAKLQDVIDLIAPNYDSDVVDMSLGNFTVQKANGAKILKAIKDTYGVVSFFRGKKLTCGFPYQFEPQEKVFVYDMQKNVVDYSGLKFRDKDDNNFKVKAISNHNDGTKLTVELGDADGAERTLNFPEMTESELRKLATAEMEKIKVEGYEGDIIGFGLPVVQHGEITEFRNKEFPERNGQYFVDKVVIDVSVNGYRRTSTIGKQSS